jgi:hypothetical protein
MKAQDLEEILKTNPAVDREQVLEALAIIKELIEDGVAPFGSHALPPERHGIICPDPKYDPRTVKLLYQL